MLVETLLFFVNRQLVLQEIGWEEHLRRNDSVYVMRTLIESIKLKSFMSGIGALNSLRTK